MDLNFIGTLIDKFANFEMPITDPFGEFIEDEGWDLQGDAPDMSEALCQLFDGEYFDYKYGATKMVVIFPEKDIVVKIPFNGSYYFDSELYDEDDEKGINPMPYDYTKFETFYNADSETGWDYCDAEVNKFINAEEENLDKYFAETDFLCFTKGGYPIYIQEKCSRCKGRVDTNRPSYKTAQNKVCSREAGGIGYEPWIADFIDAYGEGEFDRLVKFLDSDEDLCGDLHFDNIGYNSKGLPIIMDYAGFNH